jgi:hypothetical protein
MSLYEPLPAPGLMSRLPLIGPISRAVGRDIDLIFYLLVIALTVLVLAIKTWGIMVLTLTALALVPVMFIIFVWITWP